MLNGPDGTLMLAGASEEEVYVTGMGQLLWSVHPRSEGCFSRGCVIHAPSDHCMRGFPTLWREDRGLMERVCSHGTGHPDPDDMSYKKTILTPENYHAEGIHGCCGCCHA